MPLPSIVSSTLRSSLLLLAVPFSAQATNGYFAHGIGVKAQGQAGVGIAWSQDALAAATNPAGTALVGDRIDLGGTWFVPRRRAEIVGNAFGPDARFDGNADKNFFIPEFGYAKQLSPTIGAGLAVYGNGGMNTRYRSNPYSRFGATGTAGVNLEQLFVTPSIAWKPHADHSIGIGLNIAYQRFKADGLGLFGGFSASPTKVSNLGTDTTVGAGVRLGWIGNVSPGLTLGATWSSKVHGKFDDYRGLFSGRGGFDVPENYGVGVAFRPDERWTLGVDVQRIRYSRVASVGNPIDSLLQGVPLGVSDGPGFGWRDITAVKFAVSHKLNANLELRAGYSHSQQPVPSSQTFFNILAPGVVQNHFTLGATWTLADGGELSGFLGYAPGKTVHGQGSIPAGNPPGGFGGGNANVRLRETMLGVAYAWKP